jgi:hypothetical protein
MQTATVKSTTTSKQTQPVNMRKRIGSTVYEVRVYFNKDAKETMDEKILRLINYDCEPKNGLNFTSKNDILVSLQTERLPEGSSV